MSAIDWTDVRTLMSGLEGIHEVRVELTVTTATPASNTRLDVRAFGWVATVAPQQIEVVGEVVGTWPDEKHQFFDGFVFNLLYDLDRAIGKHYAQRTLPG